MELVTKYGTFSCDNTYQKYDYEQLTDVVLDASFILDINDVVSSLIFSYMNPSVNIYSFQDSIKSFNMLQTNIRNHKINNITVLYNNVSNDDIKIDHLNLLKVDIINNVHNDDVINSAYHTIETFRPIIVTTFLSNVLESLCYTYTRLDYKYLYKPEKIDTLAQST